MFNSVPFRRIRASLFAFAMIAAVFVMVCNADQESDALLSRVGIDEPVLLFEIPDFRQLLSECSRLRLWTDSRWERVFELLGDQENGVLQDDSPTHFDAFTAMVERFQFERVFVVVTSIKPLEFELFLKSKCNDLEATANDVFELGQSMLRENGTDEAEKQAITDSAAKTDLDSPDAKSAMVNWQVVGNWIVVGATQNCLDRGIARLNRTEPVRRSISQSRKNRLLDQILRSNVNATSDTNVYIKLDPRFFLEAGWYNEDWYNALRVDELLGVGVRVGIRNLNGEPAVAVSGFVLTSTPRIGLGSFVKSVEIPAELPPIPENADFLSISSLDRQLIWKGYETAYDEVFEGNPGKHLIFGSQYETRPKFVQEYLQCYAEFLKNIDGCIVEGRYRDHETLGTGAFKFSKVEPNEKNLAIVDNMLQSIARVEGRNEYREIEINGYPAHMSSLEKTSGNVLWWHGWLLQGNSRIIEHFAYREQPVKLNYEIAQEIKQIQTQFGHSDKILIVRAYWPEYFTSQLSTVVYDSIREKYMEKNNQKAYEAFKSYWSNFNLAEPGKPLSKSQAKMFAFALAGQILRDAIGKVVILATDEENGFRISATHFPMRAKSDSGSEE